MQLLILSFLSLFYCHLSPGIAHASNTQNEIQIIEHKVPGTKYRKFEGQIFLRATLLDIKHILNNSQSYPDWLHNCLQVQVLSGRIEKGQAYLYLVYAAPRLPWYLFMVPPPKNRDMVLHLSWSENKEIDQLIVNLESVISDNEEALRQINIPEDPALTPVKKVSVRWECLAMDEGVTLKQEMFIDPNHPGVDLGIMKKYTRRMVQQTLSNIRYLVESNGSP